MHLHEDDVIQVLSHIPYLTLSKQGSAKRYIDLLVRDGVELKSTLAQFPAVQYQPLDQHYSLLRGLGGLSEDLVSDLCAHYTWRGIVWASFLIALAPDTKYRKYLTMAYERAPLNQWLVELALAEIDRTVWSSDTRLQDQIHKLRSALSHSPLPATVFRRAPNGSQLIEINAVRERVKAAYRSGGLGAARKEMQKVEGLNTLDVSK